MGPCHTIAGRFYHRRAASAKILRRLSGSVAHAKLISMSTLPPASPRRAPWLAYLGLALALLLHASLVISWRGGVWNRFAFDTVATGGRRGWDFYALYQAGHNLWQGISIYESDNERLDVVVPWYTPYRYLPPMAATLGVLANALPARRALIVWVTLEEMILLGCAWASWRMGRSAGERLLLAAMWLCFTPFYVETYLGQFSLVQAALLLALLRPWALSALPSRSWRYDLSWAASLLWKQNTALLAPLWLRLRRWRILAVGAVAVLASSAPYFLWDPAGLNAFAGNFKAGTPAPNLGNLGVRQWLYSLLAALWPSLSSGAHARWQAVWVATILGLMLYLTWRRPPHALWLGALWMSGYFLIYHDVWEHHYLFVVPIYVCLVRQSGSRFLILLWALTAIWTPYRWIDPLGVAAYHTPMRWTPLEPRWLDVVYHASKALPTLCLWGWIVVRILRAQEHPERSP